MPSRSAASKCSVPGPPAPQPRAQRTGKADWGTSAAEHGSNTRVCTLESGDFIGAHAIFGNPVRHAHAPRAHPPAAGLAARLVLQLLLQLLLLRVRP